MKTLISNNLGPVKLSCPRHVTITIAAVYVMPLLTSGVTGLVIDKKLHIQALKKKRQLLPKFLSCEIIIIIVSESHRLSNGLLGHSLTM